MLIGAHVSSSGGIKNSIKNATNLGVEYLQTFLSAPQSYRINELSPEIIEEFLTTKENSAIKQCYAHAIYLLNFASDNKRNVYLSRDNLIKTLNISAKVRFAGVIIHLGSTKDTASNGIKAEAEELRIVLEETDPNSILILENSAGSGNHIGSNYDHIKDLIELNKANPRLKVCIDTQHSFAAGYDIKNDPHGVLNTLFSKIDISRLALIHLNDSKTPFDSKKDRHENIGEGEIGYEALKEFCTDPRLKDIPFILEVPGFEGNGPDNRNIEIVRSFEN